MALAASLVLLPETQLNWTVAQRCSADPARVSYLGIVLVPSLSIHMSSDILEPHLAGTGEARSGTECGRADHGMSVYVDVSCQPGAIVSGLAIGILAGTF